MKTILVTGGAGYIGSHTVHLLLENNYNVLIIDNFDNGVQKNIPENVKFYQIDLRNISDIRKVFSENQIDAVVHFSGYIEAGESMADPYKFYNNNTFAGLNLLKVMIEQNVKKIVFSSTAAVYGEPEENPITENSKKIPTNFYGSSKLMFENILDSFEVYGMKNICLRYFNACGAAFGLGEEHKPETHLIPLVLDVALGKREHIKIFGTDYQTLDGTCIRDYIHVLDLAKAHVLALKHLEEKNTSLKLNVGTSKGFSVKEIIDKCREVTGHPIPAIESSRRDGDPTTLVASAEKIKDIFNWESQEDLNSIISSAWEWHKKTF
ncbi:UDP-glucose 4-epimerase GalE [archaeon]|nr:UDP-glucose 4-epimerase GalE [archaeon]